MPNTPKRLFGGSPLAAFLNDRTLAAVKDAQALALADFVDGDPSDHIADAHDMPDAPVVQWDAPRSRIEPTGDQRMRAISAWPISGDPSMLTLTPTRRWITVPSVQIGMIGDTVALVLEDHRVTPETVISGRSLTRRYVDTHLAGIASEIAAWRPRMRRTVGDAVAERRRLLDELAALDTSAALGAVAP